MKKNKTYLRTKFHARVIEEAHNLFISKLDPSKDIRVPQTLRVSIDDETWHFDSLEEFLAEYPKANSYWFDHIDQGCRLIVNGSIDQWGGTDIDVEFSSRPPIEAVFQVFERNHDQSRLPEPPKPAIKPIPPLKVFIGHGRDPQWRDLKDHLHEKHGVDVTAYEIGPRAGLSIKEVLQKMIQESSFALLVLTGEDIHTDGELHARENVIHELGLFQGVLGFERAIALLEDGVTEFSNILGINQIRFPKGAIRETFGDVVAALKREFNENF